MKGLTVALLLAMGALPLAVPAADYSAQGAQAFPGESLGRVSFTVSCAPKVRASFSRGVALLHDFWYEEARPQFERIEREDPHCAMAHWGVAMSVFHQIWDRPDDTAVELGRRELQAAQSPPAKTARERGYIAALQAFFRADARDYQHRIDDYAADMGTLHGRYPDDTDAAALYALALLAAEAPDDTTLTAAHRAMSILTPLFAEHPDHPGVVHYIIHACDTPSLAVQGLAAARHYGEIAASGPHAVHMPGHIFARLGMWKEDVDSNAASVAASNAAQLHHQDGAMDQFHSDDFLLYAFLQTADDGRAAEVIDSSKSAISRFETMPGMGDHYMEGMFPYYRTKLPVFFALEMRDWQAAAALEPVPGARPETQTLTYWARAVAEGHLRRPAQVQAALGEYDALIEKVRQGRHAYYADSIGARIVRGEMLAWSAFAADRPDEAFKTMRESADLQDKVGQGEVDIPAREMLADMLLESGRPQQALAQYSEALRLSPNRFNGLYNAGRAAEASGDKARAHGFYAALLESTNRGAHSVRPEFDHVKAFESSAALAGR